MPSGYSSGRSARARQIVAAQLPGMCVRCHGLVTAEMSWEADHIIGRAVAIAAGWTQQMIDDPSNLGPAHSSCNHKANQRPRQTKEQIVEKRIVRVVRPTLEKNSDEEVFSVEDQNPGCCPTVSLPDAPQESQNDS